MNNLTVNFKRDNYMHLLFEKISLAYTIHGMCSCKMVA